MKLLILDGTLFYRSLPIHIRQLPRHAIDNDDVFRFDGNQTNQALLIGEIYEFRIFNRNKIFVQVTSSRV